MLIDINKIKVEKRIRKAYGDIEGLATSIRELGLLNPPVVTPDFELVAGERRLKALKHLNYQQIEVNVMTFSDYETKFRAEIEENEQRLEFTFSERMEWARELEQIERGKADERKKSGNNQYSLTQEFVGGEKGESAEKVAEKTGFGNKETYRQAKFVFENADSELIKLLDEEQISTHAAYQKLKKEKDDVEEELQREKLAKQALIDSAQSFASMTDKEVTPKHVEEELIKEKEDNKILEQKVRDLELKRSKLEKDLKEIEDYEKSEQADINNLKKQKEKLELQAHISISNLQIGIHSFVEKYSPSVFLQGAVASTTFMMKDDLLDSIVALEEFTRTLREILNAKIIKNKDIIDIKKLN